MDFQFWIWLIVIVITLIARANKKKAAQPPVSDDSPDSPQQSRPNTQPKSVTFEDLLREIQGAKELSRKSEPPKPKPAPKEYDFVDYDDDIKEEIEDIEDVDYDVDRDEKAFETYEAAKKEVFETPALSEEPKKIGKIMRSEHFREYDLKKKKRPFNFLKELKEPGGFKKAFIMSEILKRKY